MTRVVLKRMDIRQHGPGYSLALREPELNETCYTHLIWLPEGLGRAICGPHTGIHMLYGAEPMEGVTPKPIRIERVEDREPGTRPWIMRIGDELVMATLEGVTRPRRLSDEGVRALQDHAVVLFEPGQPDWDLRRVEDLEDAAIEAESVAERRCREAQAARASWEAARAADLPGP